MSHFQNVASTLRQRRSASFGATHRQLGDPRLGSNREFVSSTVHGEEKALRDVDAGLLGVPSKRFVDIGFGFWSVANPSHSASSVSAGR